MYVLPKNEQSTMSQPIGVAMAIKTFPFYT